MVRMAPPVSFARVAALVLVLAAASASAAGAPEPSSVQALPSPEPVREALGRGRYPWYDAKADRVKPLWPPREWELDRLDRWLRGRNLAWLPRAGNLLAFLLAMIGLSVLLAVLFRLWRQNRPGMDELLGAIRRGPGAAARIEGLPEGLRPETGDPWSEAIRCRERGDYARAVVCLFAHQLLTLERLRLVRLDPGRTARQLVRAVADRRLRDAVEPTLRLFEAVYYGRKMPSPETFEAAWAAAEAFERHVAEGVAG